jgi:hypothetical protein
LPWGKVNLLDRIKARGAASSASNVIEYAAAAKNKVHIDIETLKVPAIISISTILI